MCFLKETEGGEEEEEEEEEREEDHGKMGYCIRASLFE